MIRNIQLYHAGKYICVVDTDVESLSAVAVLIVKGKKRRLRAPLPLIKAVRVVPLLHFLSFFVLTERVCNPKWQTGFTFFFLYIHISSLALSVSLSPALSWPRALLTCNYCKMVERESR